MKNLLSLSFIISIILIGFGFSFASNPFENKQGFEIKRYDSQEETSFYKDAISIDHMDEFESVIVKYLKSVGYDTPLGMRPTATNLRSYIAMEKFLTWKNELGEKLTMCIYKAPNTEDSYLVSFLYKAPKVSPRFKG